MRRAVFFILAAGIFVSQPAAVWAEEGGVLLKGGVSTDVDAATQAQLNAEDSRHDGKMMALDAVERAEDKDHETKLELIEESDSDAKSLMTENENAKHENKKKDIERQRSLEEKIHSERAGEIIKKAKKLLSKAASAAGDAFEGGSEGSQGRSPSNTAQNPAAGMGEAPSSNTGPWPDVPSSPANPPLGDQEQQQQQAKPSDEAKKRELEQAKKQAAEKKRQEEARQQQQQQAKKEAAEKKRQQERQQAQQKQAQRQEQKARALEQANNKEEVSAPPGAVEKWKDESIPGRMMKLANELDRIADDFQDNAMAASNQFCGGMADSLSKSAKFLAQKPGTVLPQMADGLLTYLTNDYNENNQQMYDDAVKAVDELEKNPARFFGEHAVDAAMSAAGGGGPVGGLGAVRKVGQTTKKLGQAEKKAVQAARQQQEAQRRQQQARKTVERARQERDIQRRQEQANNALEKAKQQQEQARKAADKRSYEDAVKRQQVARKELERVKQEQGVQQRQQQQDQARRAAAEKQHQEAMKRQQVARKDLEKVKQEQALRQRQQQHDQSKRADAEKQRQEAMRRQQQQAKALEQAGKTLKDMAETTRKFSSFDLMDTRFKGPLNVDFPAKANAGAISKTLKRNFGGGKAKDPRHGGPQGLRSHEEGVPLASDQKKIESALKAAGKDSQGLVFVDEGTGTPGRIFNVRNNSGKIEFWDSQTGQKISAPLKWKRVFFYRLG